MTPVERVARAVQAAKINGQRVRLSDEYAQAIARAAIAALAEPSEGMIKAAEFVYEKHYAATARGFIEDMHQTMIAAALEEKP